MVNREDTNASRGVHRAGEICIEATLSAHAHVALKTKGEGQNCAKACADISARAVGTPDSTCGIGTALEVTPLAGAFLASTLAFLAKRIVAAPEPPTHLPTLDLFTEEAVVVQAYYLTSLCRNTGHAALFSRKQAAQGLVNRRWRTSVERREGSLRILVCRAQLLRLPERSIRYVDVEPPPPIWVARIAKLEPGDFGNLVRRIEQECLKVDRPTTSRNRGGEGASDRLCCDAEQLLGLEASDRIGRARHGIAVGNLLPTKGIVYP